VRSVQTQPHPRLHEIVSRHITSPYRREPSAAGRRAFDGMLQRLAAAPFVLDAGCGTGLSALALAREFPDRLVVGVDKSVARLAIGRRGFVPANVVLLHCELVDFWQLAAAAQLRCECQYLLYPNPWPKPAQVKRRWHAHAIFPAILALGGTIELRTNWRIYAEEFAQALALAGIESRCEPFMPQEPLTPFERKYAASGHALWRCRCRAR